MPGTFRLISGLIRCAVDKPSLIFEWHAGRGCVIVVDDIVRQDGMIRYNHVTYFNVRILSPSQCQVNGYNMAAAALHGLTLITIN